MSDKIEPRDRDLMKQSGLIVADDQPDTTKLPTLMAGWKAVTNLANIPLYQIDDTNPPEEYLPEVDRIWLETARAKNLFADDGTFIISGTSPTSPRCTPWIRVRLSDHTRLAQTLSDHPGEPNFVAMSNSGTTLVSAQTEENGIWIIHEEI